MNYKKKIQKAIKLICLRRKLRSLEKSRLNLIESYIASNPSQASKADDIEKLIVSENFSDIQIKIKLLKRVIEKI